jgi:hypothetical protein
MAKRNFLLGKGERLAADVQVPMGGGDKAAPYTFSEAKNRLQPMLNEVVNELKTIPKDACPDDFAIAIVTLNPEYIAKSYHPEDLLRATGLEAVGSRSRKITPEKRSQKRVPEEKTTTELFLMGKRQAFMQWAAQMPSWNESTPGAKQIIEIEQISFPNPTSKIKGINPEEEAMVFEVILHLNEDQAENRFLGQFQQYLRKFRIQANFHRRFYSGGYAFWN